MSQGGSANRIILVGVVLVLLLFCAGTAGTGLIVGLLALVPQEGPGAGSRVAGPRSTSGTETAPSDPEIVPLTLGVQPNDETVDHRRRKPLILPGTVSGPPTTIGAFEADQCDDIPDGGSVAGPDCITAELKCDRQIIGHTVGGVDLYDTKFYEKKFCWPATIDHDGGDERVYKLVMPPGEWRAWVDLHSPCADLDVAAVRYDHGGDRCPDMSSTVNQCEMKPSDGMFSERIELTSQTGPGENAVWYIIVEGKDAEEGPFSLYVQCSEGLGGALR